jgi:hypothetical protein
VARADFLEIRFGISRWLKMAQAAGVSLGLLAILLTPANWKWKLGSILLLLLLAFVIQARSVHDSRFGTIRLFADGTALLRMVCGRKIKAVQGPHGWTSRWFSVLVLLEPDGVRKRHCVICASENRPDDYRQLLVQLRMRTAPESQRMIW